MRNGGDVPKDLLAARRELFEIAAFELIEDFFWDSQANAWVLKCRLKQNGPTNRVPTLTSWYVVISPEYPHGEIGVFPAAEDSIIQTFPHQESNIRGSRESKWRAGKLCLADRDFTLNRLIDNPEPLSSRRRLKWHIKRAVLWLSAAAKGELTKGGDYFELPPLPNPVPNVRIAFSESEGRLAFWKKYRGQHGFFTWSYLSRAVQIVREFQLAPEPQGLTYEWGAAISKLPIQDSRGIWIMLDKLPVISEAQLPFNWGELFSVCSQHKIDLKRVLQNSIRALNALGPVFLLIGFPIAGRIGGAEEQIHWLGIALPEWTHPDRAPNGFRPNFRSVWKYDELREVGACRQLQWVKTENWHHHEISTRGKASAMLREKRIVVIGVGALGSMVVEDLARLGVTDLLLIDSDVVEVGNLVRHSLTINEVGQPKALAVAERLNAILPQMRVDYFAEQFPPNEVAKIEALQACDVVIDCTGSNAVIHAMQSFNWETRKAFFSASVNPNAEKLFLYRQHGLRFSANTFLELMEKPLVDSWKETAGLEFPREGIGCYHPVFPARFDSMAVWGSVVVNHIDKILNLHEDGNDDATLHVLKLVNSSLGFLSIEHESESCEVRNGPQRADQAPSKIGARI